MSMPQALRDAFAESRQGLIDHAGKQLDSPSQMLRMKSRFALNVVIPFLDWFEDENDTAKIAEVVQCATEGLGHMVALLASTAGDDLSRPNADLILGVINQEVKRMLSGSNE